jgi:myosin heavy chain 9/10/11/14
LEKKIVDLKSELAEKRDEAAAAIEKMKRSEIIAAEAQKEIASERQSIVQLHKDKVSFFGLRDLFSGNARKIGQ